MSETNGAPRCQNCRLVMVRVGRRVAVSGGFKVTSDVFRCETCGVSEAKPLSCVPIEAIRVPRDSVRLGI